MTVIQETVIYADAVKFCVASCEAPIIAIKIGEEGYWPIYSKFSADQLNAQDVTPEIVESAVTGSMFGWGCPTAKAALQYAQIAWMTQEES
jgi:hypothetical protein